MLMVFEVYFAGKHRPRQPPDPQSKKEGPSANHDVARLEAAAFNGLPSPERRGEGRPSIEKRTRHGSTASSENSGLLRLPYGKWAVSWSC